MGSSTGLHDSIFFGDERVAARSDFRTPGSAKP
jgi:hypothetical protein